MKFSTIVLLLSSGLLSATSSADEACLNLDNLVFQNCKVATIVDVVEAELEVLAAAGTACTHPMRTEVKLLAGATKFGFAKKLLRARCRAGRDDIRVPCTEWEDVQLDSCTLNSIQQEISNQFATFSPGECLHDEAEELKILTGSRNPNQARKYVKAVCGSAWLAVDHSTYRNDIDSRFKRNFMNEYTNGFTSLNTETGNFQGDDNPKYPTLGSEARTMGANIASFQGDGNNNSVLQPVNTLKGCDYQSMMCCFGRDRQVDNDGNCANNDCENADPGDNSNLCKIGEVAFPGQEEGDIHCHGIAWASDTNDATAQLKFNNWFYVSMYDHMYKRGYVEQLLAGNPEAIDKVGIDALPPMCGCMEDMPVVSRSDCTEIVATQNFMLNVDDDMLLSAMPEGALKINFESCNGIDYNDGAAAGNDLASYVNVLHRDDKLSDATREKIFEHLVGYEEPGDNENEAACQAAVAN